MRILITNDDNIHANGLKILKSIAEKIGHEVWVVAPECDQSGIGHAISMSNPLRLRQLDKYQFALTGTPVDCILVALKHLMPHKPDLILSGINDGANIGHAMAYSGTYAAAREGMVNGILSLAISQASYYNSEKRTLFTSYEVAEYFLEKIINRLLEANLVENMLFNLNFPACKISEVTGVKVGSPSKNLGYEINVTESKDPLLRPVLWLQPMPAKVIAEQDTDVSILSENKISITPFSFYGFAEKSLNNLQKLFA
ncbi:5'/3'-nucleotidase SurE [Bartonella sp. DGB1]|uniref:5'/3'-nucleotidase SurE n=1 Tax=Bartonella sp. DGB1 TaxID=3239807 RepID=UPI003524AA0E